MTCKEILEIAPLYLSGELEVSELAAIHGHLAGCRSCAQEINRQAALDTQIREEMSGDMPDPTAVVRSVWGRIRVERARKWAIGVAAAAGVVLAVVMGYRAMRPSPVYADVALDHHQEVVEHKPRKWRTDAAEIEKLAARYDLPDVAKLAPAGYRLEHAKMCGIDGKPALHLVYTNGSQEVSVFVRSGAGTATQVHQVRVGSEQIAAFQANRVETIVATNGPSEECLGFARVVAAVL